MQSQITFDRQKSSLSQLKNKNNLKDAKVITTYSIEELRLLKCHVCYLQKRLSQQSQEYEHLKQLHQASLLREKQLLKNSKTAAQKNISLQNKINTLEVQLATLRVKNKQIKTEFIQINSKNEQLNKQLTLIQVSSEQYKKNCNLLAKQDIIKLKKQLIFSQKLLEENKLQINQLKTQKIQSDKDYLQQQNRIMNTLKQIQKLQIQKQTDKIQFIKYKLQYTKQKLQKPSLQMQFQNKPKVESKPLESLQIKQQSQVLSQSVHCYNNELFDLSLNLKKETNSQIQHLQNQYENQLQALRKQILLSRYPQQCEKHKMIVKEVLQGYSSMQNEMNMLKQKINSNQEIRILQHSLALNKAQTERLIVLYQAKLQSKQEQINLLHFKMQNH